MLTGHTGFKGGWLALWLQHIGSEVSGFSLPAPTSPSLFEAARIADNMHSIMGDIREAGRVTGVMQAAEPEIVFHLAAQPLVRHSYREPVETYMTNVMGTVHVLEAVRKTQSVKVVINITSDKCYENREWPWGYRENEPMGGFDPYSSSKGCAELVSSAYRNSFFSDTDGQGVRLASVRAGNVIGGGDWAEDRLIPDILRAFVRQKAVVIRNPTSIRPWQHVLEPLAGYMLLAERLFEDASLAQGWNFGPRDEDAKPVNWIVEQMARMWGDAKWELEGKPQPHEAQYLKLDCSMARTRLGWEPRWDLLTALEKVTSWHKAWLAGQDMRAFCLQQIDGYMTAVQHD